MSPGPQARAGRARLMRENSGPTCHKTPRKGRLLLTAGNQAFQRRSLRTPRPQQLSDKELQVKTRWKMDWPRVPPTGVVLGQASCSPQTRNLPRDPLQGGSPGDRGVAASSAPSGHPSLWGRKCLWHSKGRAAPAGGRTWLRGRAWWWSGEGGNGLQRGMGGKCPEARGQPSWTPPKPCPGLGRWGWSGGRSDTPGSRHRRERDGRDEGRGWMK